MKAFVTVDGKRAILDTEKDKEIISTWTNRATRWTNLYVHQTKSGNGVLYLEYNTRWQGESNSIDTDKSEIKEFLIDNYDEIDEEDVPLLRQFYPSLFEED